MHICSKPSFAQSSTSCSYILASLLVTVLLGSANFSYAQTAQPLDAIEYYTIDETQPSFTEPVVEKELRPENFFSMTVMVAKVRALAVSLLRWTLHPESPGIPREKYNRIMHFGRWVNDPTDKNCYNTRAKVLIRDSVAPVSFKQRNHCLVENGGWYDPYEGKDVSTSRDIQIDHMVPLKNAYVSGAWEWDFQTRCMYANFMGNEFHLISASGRENMRKGDRSPDQYMPPNLAYRCEYLENWLKIKLIWKLKLTPSEVEAIRSGIEENGCDAKKFALSQGELRRQRKLINEHNYLCPVR